MRNICKRPALLLAALLLMANHSWATTNLFCSWGEEGAIGTDWALHLTLDASSNLLVCGKFSNTVGFNLAKGVHTNVTCLPGAAWNAILCKYDPNDNCIWVNTWGGSNLETRAQSVAADATGNVYVVGCMKGTNDFNPSGFGPVGHTNVVAFGDQDAFLCKFDPNGVFQWVRHWGGGKGTDGYRVALDPAGFVYAVGDWDSTNMDLNPYPAPGTAHDVHTNRWPAGVVGWGYDAWLCKWSSDGVYQWGHTWGGNGYDDCCALTVDGLGNVFTGGFLGSTNNTCDFNTNTNQPHQAFYLNAHNIINPTFVTDGFISMFKTNGDWVTALNVGGTNGNQVCVLQADGLGNVYACGYFARGTNGPNGPVDFNPRGANTIRLTSHGLEDAFLAKYDTNGICLWANGWGGATNDSAWGVALDPYGYVYAVGNFYSQPCNFNPGAGTYNLSAVTAGSSSLYFSKFSANTGKFIMARACGGSSDVQSLASCVADADNNLYMGGRFAGNADFGPLCGGPVTNTASPNNDFAFFCRVYTGPALMVYSNTTVITNNDLTPTQAKGTAFGNVNLGLITYTNSLTLTNTGFANLLLNGITLVGNTLGFSTDAGGITNIDIGASAKLNLLFAPWDNTPKTGNVTFVSNDGAGSYTFGISGCGVAIGLTQTITALSGTYGTISPSGTVLIPGGGKKAFANTPNVFYHLSSVAVDNANQGAVQVYIFTNVMAAHTITNVFVPDLSPSNTPNWWLAQYNLTNGGLSFAQAETNTGSSGIPVWQAYIAGLDPTNLTSQFTVRIGQGNGKTVVWVPTIVPTSQEGNRLYTIENTTNLLTGPWAAILACTDVPATIGPQVTYTNQATLSNQFYRATVRLTVP